MRTIFVALIAVTMAFAIGYADLRSFEEWANKHKKSYKNSAEKSLRFRNFQASIERIAKNNANKTGAVFGLTQFSDMSPEEFRSTILMKNKLTPRHNPNVAVNVPKNVRAPGAFDWRSVTNTPITPVKDQGQCGSCWAFSVAETTESCNILNNVSSASALRVSEQQIVDCDHTDGGCNGGNPETAWQYIISTGGLDSEASYPYTAEDGTCAFNAKNIVAKVSGWKYATTSGDENTLKNNLLVEPLSICVDAANWQDYTSGVMTAWQCAWINELDHCVQLVGYSTTASDGPYWIVRNSWSASWGENGYIRLAIGDNACGLTEEATMPSM